MLRTAWRFRAFLRRFLPSFGWGAFLVVLSTLIDLAQPWPLKVIVDGAIDHNPQTGWLPQLIAGPSPSPNVWNGTQWVTTTSSQTILVRSLVFMVILVGFGAIFDFVSDMLMDRAGEKIVVNLRTAMFSHLQRLSLSFHAHQRVGDLTSRITVDIDRVQSMLVAIFDTFLPNIVMLVGLAAVMLWVDFSFGLLSLAISPLLFWVTYRYTTRIKRAARRAREADARIAMHANETLGAVRSVQAFNREAYEDDRFAMHNDESLDAALESVRLRSTFTPLVDIVALLGTLLVTYVGVHQVLDGTMSLGVLLVYLSYIKSMYRPMRALSKMSWVVSRGTTSAERVEEVLHQEDRLPEPENPIVPERLAGAIELRDVTFRYSEGLPTVLVDADLSIAPGERVGVVGRTGAGKSTLVSLIPRFFDPEKGSIVVDGVDVRELDLATLRRQVSLVLQDAVIFHGTISDNIRYADPDASDERVMEVAEAAHVTEFLDRLPDGLETEVGERGATLSGGQRQRIAIARAMLADSPILILDEPTTGLDKESEAMVLDGLARLSAGKTTIVISHHEAALRDVSRIIHVADGHLTEGPGLAAQEPAHTDPDAADEALGLVVDDIADHTFSTVTDGYAPHEVDAYLARLSTQLEIAAERHEKLVEELALTRAMIEPTYDESADSVGPAL
jgi:subfamily B ATP-binding cassette protein MsbA